MFNIILIFQFLATIDMKRVELDLPKTSLVNSDEEIDSTKTQ